MMSNSRAGMAFTVRLYLMLCRNTLGAVTFMKVLLELNALIVSTSTCLLSAAGDAGSARLLTHLGEYAEKKNQRAPPTAPPENTEPIEIYPMMMAGWDMMSRFSIFRMCKDR
jgi:hypothetical protein